MDIPKDILLIIFNFLPITGKRFFLQTCSINYDELKTYMLIEESKFIDMINNTIFVDYQKVNFNRLTQYTSELLYDGYVNMIPKKYINEKNDMLFEYKNVYFNVSKIGNLENIKLLLAINDKFNLSIVNGIASGGHLEVLKWARENGCHWNEYICYNAAWNGHLEVLKWG